MTTVLKRLNQTLHEVLGEDERVHVLGEDLLDPYGGAFKVTKGLSTAFPDRVRTTPISEGGFVGLATGMALRGLLPVVEIMFGDFLTLACDQLINHAAKFSWMYGDKVRVPLVVRAPMGGRRGYGPTHSQCLEKHFLGVPGLQIVAVHPLGDPGALLRRAILEEEDPLLFIENKTMYARPTRGFEGVGGELRMGAFSVAVTEERYPGVVLSTGDLRPSPFRPPAQATIAAYGGMVELALEAAERLLIEEEVYVEVVALTQIHPLSATPLLESVARTGRLLVCEEASPTAGFGAEVVARVTEEAFDRLQAAPVRVGARELPVGNAPTLEAAILPDVDDLIRGLRRLVGPQPLSMRA